MELGADRRMGRSVIRSALLLLAMLAVGLVIAGCGGGGGGSTGTGGSTTAGKAPTGSGSADACSLLTAGEVTAVGVKTTKPQPVGSAQGGQGCNYGDDPLKGVQVIVQPGGGQAYFDQSKGLLSSPKPISGLGDEAVLDQSNPQQVTVVVRQGDTTLQLGGSISAAAAQSLAKKALARLGS